MMRVGFVNRQRLSNRLISSLWPDSHLRRREMVVALQLQS